ncbi:MAG: conjugal transfer protein TraG N-terminal domain-containing protein [Alphaproteobacteria bacterium]|nr:conjugal transfer protein TraG N-terminal domain-containing protein [Alphaproteobacteria bacterium]
MDYAITTFGGGEILEGLFNAIAVCLNSTNGTLFTPLVRLGFLIGGFMGLVYAFWGDQLGFVKNWLIPFYLILNVLFVPQTSVWILDPVHHTHNKIDHVPWGLGAFAGIVSNIGKVLTEKVEMVFNLPDDLRYQKAGHMFASHLIQHSKLFRITNEDAADNMRNFVNQCVVYDAMLGRKYTIEDLRHSDDIWGLVSSSASPVRSFVYREPHEPGSPPNRAEIITCREGVSKFNSYWGREIHQTATVFGTKIFGKHAFLNPKVELFKYLPLSYAYLTQSAKSAEQILQQQMMVHSIVDGIEQKSIELGNAPNFATRRAYLQQRTTYETLGNLAAESLPVMKNVIEALAYAAFIFILPLALLPMGWKVIGQWGGLILWIQLWAPLYAVLNFMMTVSVKSKSIAALALSNENGVTIANSVGLMNANADMAAMAGYLAMSIPFISWALVKGGAGAFVQLATHLGSVTQSVAGTTANEQSTGNYSFGNVSQGNVQAYNTSALQHNFSPSYQAGQFRQFEGRTDTTTTADGQHILSVANSNLPMSLNLAETKSQQLSERASQAWTTSQQQMQASSYHQAEAYRKVLDFATHQAHQAQLGKGLSYGETASTHHQASLFKQRAEQFANDNNMTVQEAANLLAGVSAGFNMGFVGMKGEGSLSSQSSKGEVLRKAEDFVEQHQLQETLNKAVQGMKEERFNTSDEEGRRLMMSATASLDSSKSFRREAQASLQEAKSLSAQADYSRSYAATINQNLNQEFVDWMVKQPYNGKGQIGLDETRRLLSSTDSKHHEIVQHYARDFLNQHTMNDFMVSPAKMMGLESPQRHYQEYSQILQDRSEEEDGGAFERVKTRASESGFSFTKKTPFETEQALQEEAVSRKESISALNFAPVPVNADVSKHAEEGDRQEKVTSYSFPFVFEEEREAMDKRHLLSSVSILPTVATGDNFPERRFFPEKKAEERKTEIDLNNNTFLEMSPYDSQDGNSSRVNIGEWDQKYPQDHLSSFKGMQINTTKAIASPPMEFKSAGGRSLDQEKLLEEAKTHISRISPSSMDSSSTFLNPRPLTEKVDDLFEDNKSALSSKQKQIQQHGQQIKEGVLTGQKRGLIESAAKGPISRLSELGKEVIEDLKKASDE